MKNRKLSTIPPLVYIYLDKDGIESLYAQLTDRLEVELIETRSREGRTDVGITAKLGNLFTSLLGVKEIGAETKLEAARKFIVEARTKLAVEHKIRRLSEYLTKTNSCFRNLQEAVAKTSIGEMAFVDGVEKFDAPDFYPGRGGIRDVNDSGSMVFTIEPKYDPSDAYFKKAHFTFTMPASLRNFTRLDSCMGSTSHEAIMFRGFQGKEIPLGVFGYAMRHSDRACQIKPYAIWLVAGFSWNDYFERTSRLIS